MCFCSFDNCNPATALLLKYAAKVSNWYNISCLVIIIISGLLLSNYQCSSLSVFPISTISQVNLDNIGWNPWPSDKYRCRPPNQARKNARTTKHLSQLSRFCFNRQHFVKSTALQPPTFSQLPQSHLSHRPLCNISRWILG